MDYKYDVVNYNKNIPATIMRLNMTSDMQKTELQWHREPEIIYVVKGKCECSHNGDIKVIAENNFIMLNSEDVHLVRPVSGTSCELLCIQLSFEYMRMFCKSIDSVFFDSEVNPEIKEKIIKILNKLNSVYEQGDYKDRKSVV